MTEMGGTVIEPPGLMREDQFADVFIPQPEEFAFQLPARLVLGVGQLRQGEQMRPVLQ